jgi:hypothetical protein
MNAAERTITSLGPNTACSAGHKVCSTARPQLSVVIWRAPTTPSQSIAWQDYSCTQHTINAYIKRFLELLEQRGFTITPGSCAAVSQLDMPRQTRRDCSTT